MKRVILSKALFIRCVNLSTFSSQINKEAEGTNCDGNLKGTRQFIFFLRPSFVQIWQKCQHFMTIIRFFYMFLFHFLVFAPFVNRTLNFKVEGNRMIHSCLFAVVISMFV